jgi:starch synthase
VDVRVILPGYPQVRAALRTAAPVAHLAAQAELPAATVLFSELPNGIPLFVVECPALYDRPGGPYQDPHGRDWPDNPVRFGLFSRAAAMLACDSSPIGWRPDVLHVNDWQGGLAPLFLRYAAGWRAGVLTTIHNLVFQGNFGREWHARLGLPEESWSMHGAEFWGQLSFLKAGLHYADAISTVSPTYAGQIQSSPLGMGMEGLLAHRRDVLHGILNGIDTATWDPSRDPLIAACYDASTLDRKAANKRALRSRFGLADAEDIPLLGVVTRLTHQKGVDLIADLADELADDPAHLAVLGTGESGNEARFEELAERRKGRIGVLIGYDEGLAHLIEAGADVFLMPSRFEPCGMNQMFSQRYGTPPVVRATGGLLDSVVDCNATTLIDGTATGFVFDDESVAGLRDAIARALEAYRDKATWQRLQRQGMARDFSWNASARRYVDLYTALARSG